MPKRGRGRITEQPLNGMLLIIIFTKNVCLQITTHIEEKEENNRQGELFDDQSDAELPYIQL